MTIPVGSIINALAVAAGGALGMMLGDRLNERLRVIVYQGLGLCTIVIGLQMALKTTNALYMVGSILIGGILGEMLSLEEKLIKTGDSLKKTFHSGNARFTDGFVTATLIVCIGAMAILGPLEEGLTGNKTIVLTKAMLDFFTCMAFGAVYGSGVLFASLPLLIYQGCITLFASTLQPYLTELMRAELTAVGGIMVAGVGINLMELKKIRLSSLLPAIVVVVALCLIVGIYNHA